MGCPGSKISYREKGLVIVTTITYLGVLVYRGALESSQTFAMEIFEKMVNGL